VRQDNVCEHVFCRMYEDQAEGRQGGVGGQFRMSCTRHAGHVEQGPPCGQCAQV
jgi:hypothetical protein